MAMRALAGLQRVITLLLAAAEAAGLKNCEFNRTQSFISDSQRAAHKILLPPVLFSEASALHLARNWV
jgi:hypothetical protein